MGPPAERGPASFVRTALRDDRPGDEALRFELSSACTSVDFANMAVDLISLLGRTEVSAYHRRLQSSVISSRQMPITVQSPILTRIIFETSISKACLSWIL